MQRTSNLPFAHRTSRWAVLAATAAVVAGSIGAITIDGASVAEASFSTTMVFPNGRDDITVGPNAGIYIDGSLDYDDFCRSVNPDGSGVTDDFLYPASDVYIVPNGGVSGQLVDAGGNGPNTIVATATGLYIGEPIAFTSPGGTLGPGVYDVVFDTCQDGYFDGEDEIFFEAITVVEPDGDVPPASDAIRRIKDREKEQFLFWTQMHETIALMFKVDKAAAVLECILMASPECLAKMILVLRDQDHARAQLNNRVEDLVLGLTLNVSKNHGAIWQDPPDADYEHLPVLEPVDRELVPTAAPVHDAFVGLVGPLADEVALTEAYLHAVERYQGAQAAGDADWALIQARAALDLSSAMREQLGSTSAVTDLRDAIADPTNEVGASFTTGRQFVRRMQSSGLTGDERRILANQGFTEAELNAFESEWASLGSIPAYETSHFVAQLDDVIDARAAAVADLAASELDWAAVVAELEARVASHGPVADAGGPYVVTGGAAAALDASASQPGDGAAITAVDWDLDADGAFDDAAGVTPPATFDTDLHGVISVKVTDSSGRAAVDHAVVTVAGGDRAPVVSDTLQARATTVVVGTPKTFGATAVDPDGDALTYLWSLDGETAGTGPTFVFDPTVDHVGPHSLTVDIGGAGRPRSTRVAWRVMVTTIDADGDDWASVADCDDTRADVNPGRMEMLGNNLDDDCDTGTPDAPPGGLTGAVYSFGNSQGTGLATFNDVPVPTVVSSLGQVVEVDSTHAGGVAVLPSGEVRTWGQGFGVIGDGTQIVRKQPVSPLAVGGEAGTRLSGVVDVSTEGPGVIALLQEEGAVIAWGDNRNGQVGDLSTVDTRLYPVEVLDAAGVPVTGAVDVEQGQNTNFILKADGTVWTVGVRRCNAESPYQKTNHAVQATLFGDDIVQIAAGNDIVLARKADGTVLACSSTKAELGRGDIPITLPQSLTPKPVVGFGPDLRAVDISAGMSTAMVLTEDGAVYMWGRNLNGEMNALGVTHGWPVYLPMLANIPGDVPVVDIDNDASTTQIAVRADGTAVLWGGNYDGNIGNGTFQPNPAVGFHELNVPGTVVAGAESTWNSMVLVRPLADDTWERPMQWISASAADSVIGESAGGSVQLTLSSPASTALDVNWSFAGKTGTAIIPAGQVSVGVPVSVLDDVIDEDDELLPFTIDSVSNGLRVEGGTAMVTVVDDDDAPTVGVSPATVAEGGTSLTDVVLNVSLSAPSGHDVIVSYSTTDGSAAAGADYEAAAGSVVVPAGATSAEIHTVVIGDLVAEPHEAFLVTLSSPEHAVLGEDSVATVTIRDDEPVAVRVQSPSVTEGDGGVSTPAEFVVSVDPLPAGTTVSVPWVIEAGTARFPGDEKVADPDVLPGNGLVVLDSSVTQVPVVASVVGDDLVEDLAVETFSLRLGTVTASDGRPVVVVDGRPATVLDDDTAPDETPDTAPVVFAGNDNGGPEGSAVELSALVTDDGPVDLTWTTDAAGCAIADPSAAVTSITCADDVAAVVVLTADDGVNPAVSDTMTVTVTNVDPVISSAAYVGSGLVVEFADPGADTHTCIVDAGDGSDPVVVDGATTPCSVPHTFGPGTHVAQVTVVDDDGGDDSASIEVVVSTGYAWDGFFQPIDNDAVNVVQAGKAIPVKFSLGGDHGLDIFAGGAPTSVPVSCINGAPLDTVEETVSAGSSSLTYDPASGRYHYVWKTSKAWSGQCRLLVVTLLDGSTHTATFRFR